MKFASILMACVCAGLFAHAEGVVSGAQQETGKVLEAVKQDKQERLEKKHKKHMKKDKSAKSERLEKAEEVIKK